MGQRSSLLSIPRQVEDPWWGMPELLCASGAFRVGREPTEEAWREAEAGLQARLARRLRLPASGKFRNLFREQD